MIKLGKGPGRAMLLSCRAASSGAARESLLSRILLRTPRSNVYLIGAAHVSEASERAVQQAIRAVALLS